MGIRIVPNQVMSLGGGGFVAYWPGAVDWYVDSVSGSDSASGKTPAQAFATIAKLLTVLAAGQTVGLAKGSEWREQLTISVDNVRIGAYGTGAAPVLRGDDIIANASWTKTGGFTNLYQYTVATNYIASEPQFIRVWEDDATMLLATSQANCDATANTYWVANHDAVSITVYVHASDNSAVTGNGKRYEITTRNSGVYSWFATGVSLSGVTCRRSCGQGGVIKLGVSSTITDCSALEGGKHNVYVRRGSNLTRVTMSECYYGPNPSTLFVLNDDTPSGENTTLDSCVFSLSTYSELVTAIYGHYNVGGAFGTLTVSNCSVTNCYAGISAQHVTSTVITNFTCTEVRYALNYTDTANVTVTGLTHTATAARTCRTLSNTGVAITAVLDGVTATLADCQTAMIFSSVASTITLRNSTLTTTKAGTANQTHVNLTSAGAVFTASGNAHRAPNVASGPYIYAIAAGATIASNNNRFAFDAMWFNVGGANYGSLTAYKAGSGLDGSSVVG